MRISRREAYADDFKGNLSKTIDQIKPGDLVGYLGQPALVVAYPEHEHFIGALVEIISSGRKMKVPLGMVELKRYKNENDV